MITPNTPLTSLALAASQWPSNAIFKTPIIDNLRNPIAPHIVGYDTVTYSEFQIYVETSARYWYAKLSEDDLINVVHQGYCIVQPTSLPPSIEEFKSMFRLAGLNRARLFAPLLSRVLEASRTDSGLLDLLKALKSIRHGGSGLPSNDFEWAELNKLNLINGYGSTECGFPLMTSEVNKVGTPGRAYLRPVQPLKEDGTPLTCYRFDPVTEGKGGDGSVVLKELVVLRESADLPHHSLLGSQEDFHTGDLLEEVKPGEYIHRGRVDDWIMMANAAKCDASSIEDDAMTLCKDLFSECLAVGSSQPSPALIVEAAVADTDEKERLVQDIYKRIVDSDGHQKRFLHQRIASPDAIIIVPPGSMMRTATKGNIRRKAMEEAFGDPIATATSSVSSARHAPAQLYSPLIPTKLLHTFNELPHPIQYPQYTNPNHSWDYFGPDAAWTSGFFPATLYEMNKRRELCHNPDVSGDNIDWVGLGRRASSGLADLPGKNHRGHDVGFLSYPFVEELKINPTNKTAISIVNAFAQDLANLFIPKAHVTRSWNRGNLSVVQVIIDNMMNIDLLCTSAKLTGNETLLWIAETHADTTMRNHIRRDGSTWHVVEYDAQTGKVIRKRTGQGYSHDRFVFLIIQAQQILTPSFNSTWSRGQAWGIYGFANMYLRTTIPTYLATSRRLATYFLYNIPKDGIVPWDFNAPIKDPKVPGGVRPADSSAATIAATGLLRLAEVETSPEKAKKWIDGALMILNRITKLAWSPQWDSLLSNGTVNWNVNNYLTGTVYGDYYFVKAGNDLVRMG
ncbi:hypothetical protein V5O48_014805, partial [Marasmius crinis-equi]